MFSQLIELHKREIVKLGIGKEGITLDVSPTTLQAERKTVVLNAQNTEIEKELQDFRNVDVPLIVREQSDIIRAQVGKFNVSPEEQVELLIKSLSVVQLAWKAETIYRVILGSQIALLKFLNTSPFKNQKLPEFYTAAKKRFPQAYENY